MADRRVTACTIVARNYLPAAKVLARSYLAHHPGNDFVIAVIDAHDEPAAQEGFRVVGWEAFGIAEDDYLRMATAYSVTELATSVKPYLLRELRREYDVAIYLDPDIQVFAPMPEVAELAVAHSIVLTPHVLSPLPRDGCEPDEAGIMGSGIFNLGFIGVGPGSGEFLDFWAERLRHDAIVAPERQLFTDQRWVDNVPALFGHHVLRDPGFNVAYWNLHERPLRRADDGRLTAGGAGLRFFHFSGYRPEQPWLLTMYCIRKPRVMLSENPDLRELCDEYGAALRAAGYAETLEAVPYGFLAFGDGLPLPRLARRAFREAWIKAERKKKSLPPHAYGTDGGEALREWLAEPGNEAQAAAGLNRMALAVWSARADLRTAFPDPTGGDAEAFRAWCLTSGISEGELAGWAVPEHPPVPRPPGDEFGVNLLGYLTAELGVGEMGRIVHDAIESAGVPMASVLEERSVFNRTGVERPATLGEPRFPISVLAVNADMTRPLLGAHREVGHDRYRIGLWAWELEDFPGWMHEAFGLLDEVWTVSDFCRTAFAKHAPIPVKTIPVPVRDPGEPARPERTPGDPVRFLFAFDFNSVAQRKNPWGAVAAFQKAFPGREDVRLTIKTINGRSHPLEAERLRAAVAGDGRIELIEHYLSLDELHQLYEDSSCYVSLHRSEGFGLTVAEAMARAMPVISTDYSSTTEFLDEHTGWPIPYELVKVGKGCGPYEAESSWAEPDLDAAAAAMRQVADDPAEAGRRGRQAREHILRTRSMDTAAEWIRAELETAYRLWQARHVAPAPEHPLTPVRQASEALRWRPEPDAASRVPLAPAMRKAVLRAIDHYDVHQRRVMGALLSGTEDTAQRLLARLESIEARLDDARRAAETGRRVSERIESVKGVVDRRLNAVESSLAALRAQLPETDLALHNMEADVAKLADGFTAELQAATAATHHMFEARDKRLDNDEEALQRVSIDLVAIRDAARMAHAPVPRDADVVPCDVGALLMPVDEVMLPWIVFNRSWEDSEAELMARLAAGRSGAILDIGAHVGYHTLRLLRSCPEVTGAIAVEAHPVNAEYLRRNLRVNLPAETAELVTVVESAAWDTETTVRLAQASPGNSGDNRVSAEGPGIEVRALRLDDLPEVGAQPVTLVKVDLQGRDHRALAGLAGVLRRDRPHVVCEFCPSAIEELGDDPAAVLAGYRELGYRLIEVGEKGPVERLRGDPELIAAARANEKEFLTLWLDPRESPNA
ncbi:FkbM family methyltransferase [Amycolatopsis alkalitolerans]|uniref:FkbM family methyltransferase n=1 Tax=Amycolatopsis alkalitolerans TaxID=2547244 RepID=A0A5C4M501_9PSEU|nr:FkbM family methyltransferase [Amycolatopsis alkalitolerans]TNC27352.1 FkbM family methyltransferase [Amycolatopsis alkalitolerans]